jgi:hypothetical protein
VVRMNDGGLKIEIDTCARIEHVCACWYMHLANVLSECFSRRQVFIVDVLRWFSGHCCQSRVRNLTSQRRSGLLTLRS